MKNIAFFFALALIGNQSLAQIFVQRHSDEAITITTRGVQSKYVNSLDTTNIVLGYSALGKIPNTSKNNVAVGNKTVERATSSTNSVALGYAAMQLVSSSVYNVAIGPYALQGFPIGSNGNYNVAVGGQTLYENTSGSFNVAIGHNAMKDGNDGDENTAVGYEALRSISTGNSNTVLGYQAGYSNTSGERNIFIGYKAGYNSTTGSDNLVIENSDSSRALIRGDFVKNKLSVNRTFTELTNRNETLQISGEAFKTAGTGNWIIPSDRRLKENIVYLDSQQMLDKVLKMKGVSYNWIDKSKGTDKVFGFIAQDLQTVFPENVKTDKEGYLSASYGAYDPMIIESIKALKELIDQQRQEITNLKLRLAKTENLEAAKSDK